VSFASSLIQPSPTLSNALVAALKRAQANQHRGCVDLQQPPPAITLQQHQQQQGALQQQQQPLLAIKVELDDPSVSRSSWLPCRGRSVPHRTGPETCGTTSAMPWKGQS
jgi:hypothetical protein